MEIIRVKKECLDYSTKRLLKQWGIIVKRDWKFRKVKILILPNDIFLEKTSWGFYFLKTLNGRYLGRIFDPFEPDGGLLTFAP